MCTGGGPRVTRGTEDVSIQAEADDSRPFMEEEKVKNGVTQRLAFYFLENFRKLRSLPRRKERSGMFSEER